MQTAPKSNSAPSWHAEKLDKILQILKVAPEQGLSEREAESRLLAWGKNQLPQGKRTTWWEMFLRQFASPLVYILLIAAILTWWIKEYTDMTVILLVVAVNAVIGFFQEYRANKIFEKLKAIVRIETLVVRDRKIHALDSELLVPGDIIVLKSGAKVPADARLLEAANLETNEALLTGEAGTVSKTPGPVAAKTLVADRANMVFMGTVVEQGEGRAIVIATGGRTEIGRISLLTQETKEEKSPLQLRMGKLANLLTYVFVAISLAILATGLLKGDPVIEMIKTTIAVAVAAIPEGLPAAISIILAVGSKRILERQGLVRRLLATETLGSTSVICTDKTGTLTHGRMKVEEIITAKPAEFLRAIALANEAEVENTGGKPAIHGEATDKAKLEKFLERGYDLEQTLRLLPRVAILSFHPSRKYIAAFHQGREGLMIFVSGAPETVLQNCRLRPTDRAEIQKTYEALAARGFRLIAVAQKNLPKNSQLPAAADKQIDLIHDLEYLGLAALRDPVRDDVRATLKLTRAAGIKVLMVTGDHLLTAKAVGRELGFGEGLGSAISGQELASLSDEELTKRISQLQIIARVTPEHKLRIIRAWQNLGAVVAMTGDGVNDAPALKAADIGVAVGSGTDVSKEAADLILLDDSFSTITAAIFEGRTSFANIRKATVVVMSNAFTEVILIFSSILFGTPFPITAVQILWVNLVEDSLPVLAMAFEPGEETVMKGKPTSPKEPILDGQAKFIVFVITILTDIILVGIFWYLLKYTAWSLIKIQSFIFVATATPTLLNVFAFKSLTEPLKRIKLFNNTFLLLSVLIGFALMFAAIYLPFLNKFLRTVPLGFWPALVSMLLFPLLRLVLVELTKWWHRSIKTHD